MTCISYLVVAYCSRATIAALVDSIAAQEGDFEREVIIVDNSPTENCADLVQSRNVKYILNQQNTGYTRGVNQAIAAATGDLIFLLNPDVRLFAGCCANLLKALGSETPLQLLHSCSMMMAPFNIVSAVFRSFRLWFTTRLDCRSCSRTAESSGVGETSILITTHSVRFSSRWHRHS